MLLPHHHVVESPVRYFALEAGKFVGRRSCLSDVGAHGMLLLIGHIVLVIAVDDDAVIEPLTRPSTGHTALILNRAAAAGILCATVVAAVIGAAVRRRRRIKVPIQLQQIRVHVRQLRHLVQRSKVQPQPLHGATFRRRIHRRLGAHGAIGRAQAVGGRARYAQVQAYVRLDIVVISACVVVLVAGFVVQRGYAYRPRRRLFQHDRVR
mmetsp:Transcript_28801/g.69370  ORF Transcript_28801/g.69370 Transcript_28801/m.69370 type:complete len:208 (-) Transcript_28801:1246-1869(-)